MRARLEVALLLCAVGASAAIAAAGCDVLPDCATVDQAQGRLDGRRTDRLLCLSTSTGNVTEYCDPSKNAGPVDDRCGVFVSASGVDGGAGTKDEPVKTMEQAVAIWSAMAPPPLGGKPAIYLCGEELMEAEGVTFPSGATVFGSLDCNADGEAKWIYAGGDPARETRLTADEGKVPLRLSSGLEAVVISDVHVVAKSVPDTMPGVSSIAVIADQVEVVFVRSVLEAGDGARGMDGEPHAEAAPDGVQGNDGKAACDSMATSETTGPPSICASGDESKGGAGAPGGVSSGFPGVAGEPLGEENGGSGEGAAACTPGSAGAAGAIGLDGTHASGLGSLQREAGYIGVEGEDGKPGINGQGGGGGGSSRSDPTGATPNQCPMMMGSGASGGSGGSGGCGGAGGRGGGAGGASIGVVSIDSKLTLNATRVRAGRGGAPGIGGAGQTGGVGQPGGAGGSSAVMGIAKGCNGGKGGDGGSGGKGGDGLGGHAVGIAFTVQAPNIDSASTINLEGEPGTGAVKKDVQEFAP